MRNSTFNVLAHEPCAILRSASGEMVPLQSVSATGRLAGFIFELTVEQHFHNASAANIEAVFTFPLPIHAVLLGFELETGNRTFSATAVDRQVATERYESAIDEGDTAALIEHDGNGLYTVSLGNLMAGERAIVRYRYANLLEAHHGHVRLTVPTVIAPRYGDPSDAGLEGPTIPGVEPLSEYPFDIQLELVGLTDLSVVTIIDGALFTQFDGRASRSFGVRRRSSSLGFGYRESLRIGRAVRGVWWSLDRAERRPPGRAFRRAG